MRQAGISLSVGLIGFIFVGLSFIFINHTEAKNSNIQEAKNTEDTVSVDVVQSVDIPTEPEPISTKPKDKIDQPKKKVLQFTVTAYTSGYESTQKKKGDPLYAITASGKRATEGLTIAADWRVLPKGSRVYIEGVGERVVEDKGGAIKGNKIDVYFENLKDAREFGKQVLNVTILDAL